MTESSNKTNTLISSRALIITVIGLGILGLAAAVWAEIQRDWLPAVDGPYQTINACRRVLAGQMPGRDFNVFHGLGTIWYHSAFYALMGGNIAGSVAAYLTACFAIVWVPSALMARWAGYSKGVAIALGLLLVNVLLVTPGPLYDVVYPGGNMLGTRIALTLSVTLLAAFALRRLRQAWQHGLVAGALAASGFWISQEQGMSLTAALFATGLWLKWQQRVSWKVLLVLVLTTLLSLVSLYLIGLSVLSGGGLGKVLEFSWREIPENQFWFFGKPPKCIIKPTDLLDAKEILVPGAFSLMPWLAFGLIQRHNSGSKQAAALVLTVFLLSYALFSLHPLAGYKGKHYFAPMGHAGFLVLLLHSQALWQFAKKSVGKHWLWGGMCFTMCVCIGLELSKNRMRGLLGKGDYLTQAVVYQQNDSAFAGVAENVKETERITRFVQSIGQQGRLWSTFAGPEAEALGQIMPTRSDYIIYALSENSEREYLNNFLQYRATHVITGRESSGWIFQWMAKRYWEFHREILRAYEPVAAIGGRVLWRQRKEAPEKLGELTQACDWRVNDSRQLTLEFFTLETQGEVGVYEVRLKYRMKQGPVPLLSRRLARLGVQAEGVPYWKDIGIRVKQTGELCDFRFPVIRLGSPDPVKILVTSVSPFGAPNLEVDAVEVVRLQGFVPLSAKLLQNDLLEQSVKNHQ